MKLIKKHPPTDVKNKSNADVILCIYTIATYSDTRKVCKFFAKNSHLL